MQKCVFFAQFVLCVSRMGHRRGDLTTIRYSLFGSWDSEWSGRTNYTVLLYQDFQINRYLQGIFYKLRYASGNVHIKRFSTRVLLVDTSVYIGRKRFSSPWLFLDSFLLTKIFIYWYYTFRFFKRIWLRGKRDSLVIRSSAYLSYNMYSIRWYQARYSLIFPQTNLFGCSVDLFSISQYVDTFLLFSGVTLRTTTTNSQMYLVLQCTTLLRYLLRICSIPYHLSNLQSTNSLFRYFHISMCLIYGEHPGIRFSSSLRDRNNNIIDGLSYLPHIGFSVNRSNTPLTTIRRIESLTGTHLGARNRELSVTSTRPVYKFKRYDTSSALVSSQIRQKVHSYVLHELYLYIQMFFSRLFNIYRRIYVLLYGFLEIETRSGKIELVQLQLRLHSVGLERYLRQMRYFILALIDRKLNAYSFCGTKRGLGRFGLFLRVLRISVFTRRYKKRAFRRAVKLGRKIRTRKVLPPSGLARKKISHRKRCRIARALRSKQKFLSLMPDSGRKMRRSRVKGKSRCIEKKKQFRIRRLRRNKSVRSTPFYQPVRIEKKKRRVRRNFGVWMRPIGLRFRTRIYRKRRFLNLLKKKIYLRELNKRRRRIRPFLCNLNKRTLYYTKRRIAGRYINRAYNKNARFIFKAGMMRRISKRKRKNARMLFRARTRAIARARLRAIARARAEARAIARAIARDQVRGRARVRSRAQERVRTRKKRRARSMVRRRRFASEKEGILYLRPRISLIKHLSLVSATPRLARNLERRLRIRLLYLRIRILEKHAALMYSMYCKRQNRSFLVRARRDKSRARFLSLHLDAMVRRYKYVRTELMVSRLVSRYLERMFLREGRVRGASFEQRERLRMRIRTAYLSAIRRKLADLRREAKMKIDARSRKSGSFRKRGRVLLRKPRLISIVKRSTLLKNRRHSGNILKKMVKEHTRARRMGIIQQVSKRAHDMTTTIREGVVSKNKRTRVSQYNTFSTPHRARLRSARKKWRTFFRFKFSKLAGTVKKKLRLRLGKRRSLDVDRLRELRRRYKRWSESRRTRIARIRRRVYRGLRRYFSYHLRRIQRLVPIKRGYRASMLRRWESKMYMRIIRYVLRRVNNIRRRYRYLSRGTESGPLRRYRHMPSIFPPFLLDRGLTFFRYFYKIFMRIRQLVWRIRTVHQRHFLRKMYIKHAARLFPRLRKMQRHPMRKFNLGIIVKLRSVLRGLRIIAKSLSQQDEEFKKLSMHLRETMLRTIVNPNSESYHRFGLLFRARRYLRSRNQLLLLCGLARHQMLNARDTLKMFDRMNRQMRRIQSMPMKHKITRMFLARGHFVKMRRALS